MSADKPGWPAPLLAAALLMAHAPNAMAAGINLFWNDCSLGVTARTNRSFACDTNIGNNVTTTSFDPPPEIDLLNGLNQILDLQSASSPLPGWWRFKNTGTCRLVSLSTNTVFSAASCADPWDGGGVSGLSAYLENYGGDPSRARMSATVSIPGPAAVPVFPGTEYYGVNIVINNAKTVGTGSCSGCVDPVCIVLVQVILTQPAGSPGGSPIVNSPLTSNYVTWQGGAIGGAGCPAATPTRNRTWGAIKSLYR